MNDYIPFIHDPEIKKEWEPEQLYVELYPPPPPPKREDEEKEDTNPGVIIIQL